MHGGSHDLFSICLVQKDSGSGMKRKIQPGNSSVEEMSLLRGTKCS